MFDELRMRETEVLQNPSDLQRFSTGVHFLRCFCRTSVVAFVVAVAVVVACQAGEWAEGERLMMEMRGQGLKPDYYTYNSLMNAYAVSVSSASGSLDGFFFGVLFLLADEMVEMLAIVWKCFE